MSPSVCMPSSASVCAWRGPTPCRTVKGASSAAGVWLCFAPGTVSARGGTGGRGLAPSHPPCMGGYGLFRTLRLSVRPGLFSSTGWRWGCSASWRRRAWGARPLLGPLSGFRICFADALPQAFQGVGTRLRAEAVIRTEPLDNCLNHFFADVIGAGFGFPEIEHLCQTADNGRVNVSVLYDGLSPQSRADALKGLWKRIGETYPKPLRGPNKGLAPHARLRQLAEHPHRQPVERILRSHREPQGSEQPVSSHAGGMGGG